MTAALPTIETLSFRGRKWILAEEGSAGTDGEAARQLAAELRVPPLVAKLLVARGFATREAAEAFLDPQFKTLHEPGLLPNMEGAVRRIAGAVRAGERIVLYGDYDVDGITGTAMLWHTLRAAGVAPDRLRTYIPHRVDEGYGINGEAVERLIDEGAQLIVSVDCGVSAVEPIERARRRGVDVVVTDHHEFAAELPEAAAIVHPRLAGSGYPNPDLCGAGVAYKLAWALATHFCNGERVNAVYRGLLVDFTALVALATIADVVPLTGENRVLVKYGLQQLPRCGFAGVQALMAAAGYASGSGRELDCTAVGFGLAPRLNAAGRMDHANLAVELFTTAEPERAAEIAEYLETQNRARQSTEKSMLDDALGQIAGWAELPAVIMVHSEGHHAGIVGIVASRLVDRFHRPAFVLACGAGAEGECHGSARSIAGFEMHKAIEHCRGLLVSGGGHAMAGGVVLRRSKLEAFRERINAYAREVLRPEQFVPTLMVDGVVTLTDLKLPVVRALARFAPFGRGNANPRFKLEGMRLEAPPRRVGAGGAHMQLQIAQGRTAARAIAFKAGALAPALHVGMELDLVVEPRVDTWNNVERLDLVVTDLARADGEAFPACG